MVSLSAAELARLAGGELRAGDPARGFGHFEIDSRRVTPGGLFFAIRGGRADGHDYWPDAAAHGAAGAVTHRDVPGGEPPAVEIRVADTTAALRKLAAGVRALRPWTVVGVTGSFGKTTTKELAFMALGGRARAARSPGNFNNLFGLPLAILNAPEVSALVLEMGISTPGEMAELAALARPEIAVITAIGAAHTEFLGDEDGVLREKAAILSGGARALVYNADDARLRAFAAGLPLTALGCGFSAGAAVRGLDFAQKPGHLELTALYRGREERFALAGAGRALALDLLLALGVASLMELEATDVQAGLSYYQPGPGRGQAVSLGAGVRLLDESYNASPVAMAESLRTLADWAAAQSAARRVAVLGEMLELGDAAPAAHLGLAEAARAAGVELLLTVGPMLEAAAARFRALGGESESFADAAGAGARARALLRAGDAVLLKGSRGLRMERFIPAYTGAETGAAGKGGGHA